MMGEDPLEKCWDDDASYRLFSTAEQAVAKVEEERRR
jgi:hypothetical protein